MQTEVQPVSDANISTKLDSSADWPPSLMRLVLGAVITAVLGYIVLKTIYPIFEVPAELANVHEQSPPEVYEKLDKAKYGVDGKNFSIVFGVIGAIFGASCVLLAFGARSVKAIIVAVIGTAAMGILGVNMSNWMFNHLRAAQGKDVVIMGITLDGMKQPIVGYALLWGLIGLGVGLGVGFRRSSAKSLVSGISGLFGGILAAMLYVILTAQFSRGANMNRVFPLDEPGQAIWLVLFTTVTAICIALGSGEKRPKATAQ